jgi:hypothetical protein
MKRIIITETQLKSLFPKIINEQQILKDGFPLFYHGTTNKDLSGKAGIHVGTKMAAKQALEAKIGVPAKGEWDGTRKYGKTKLAGKKTLEKINYVAGYDPIMAFNATDDVPENDYYPSQREKRATYFSSDKLIPLDCKPIIFQVIIVGDMSNSYDNPYTDGMANGLMTRSLKLGNAKRGFYYINKWEDESSVSAVVPDDSFLKIVSEKK